MMMTVILTLLISCFFIGNLVGTTTTFTGKATTQTWQGRQTIGPKIRIFWKISGNFITMRCEARHDGWVGIGFNPIDRGMIEADMLVLLKREHSEKFDLGDYYSYGYEKPLRDTSTNFALLDAGEKNGIIWFEFVRNIHSQDSEDLSIHHGKTKLVWAFGDSFSLFKRHTTQGFTTVDFFRPLEEREEDSKYDENERDEKDNEDYEEDDRDDDRHANSEDDEFEEFHHDEEYEDEEFRHGEW